MIDTIDAALRDAMPILAATAIPTLLITAITAAMEWHRLGQDDDAFTIDDYLPHAVGRATVPHQPDPETATTDLRHHLPLAPPMADAGTPLYAHMRARQILRELARSVNGVNTGGAR